MMVLLQLNPLSKPEVITETVLWLAGSAVVGWLLARWVMARRINDLRQSISSRQSELDACMEQQAATPLRQALSSGPGNESTEVGRVPTLIESVADDLKRIEGIGPKIEGLLNADGIRTFAKLAATHPQHLAGILSAAGPRFQIHDPETWPQQAALARDGKWDELKILQSRLVGGRN